MLPSQERIITYVNKAMSSAIKRLEQAGFSEDEIAIELESSIIASIALVDYVSLADSRCWDWTIPGDPVGQWLANGGPLLPWTTEYGTFFSFLPWDAIDCKSYFVGLAAKETALADALKRVGFNGWREVMEAAADEASSRVGGITGFEFPLIVFVLIYSLFGANRNG